MRRTDGDLPLGFCLDPTPQRPPARKHERVGAVAVNHGKLEVDIKGRDADGLPHGRLCTRPVNAWAQRRSCLSGVTMFRLEWTNSTRVEA